SGSAGTEATSARQSPPGARASAASSRTLPGSCCANGRRPGAEAAERAWSRPVARTVSVSNTPPACPTPDTGATSTCTRGYNPVVFTLKVLFLQGGAHRDGAGPPRAGPFFPSALSPQPSNRGRRTRSVERLARSMIVPIAKRPVPHHQDSPVSRNAGPTGFFWCARGARPARSAGAGPGQAVMSAQPGQSLRAPISVVETRTFARPDASIGCPSARPRLAKRELDVQPVSTVAPRTR